jgi:hypothetical protein
MAQYSMTHIGMRWMSRALRTATMKCEFTEGQQVFFTPRFRNSTPGPCKIAAKHFSIFFNDETDSAAYEVCGYRESRPTVIACRADQPSGVIMR